MRKIISENVKKETLHNNILAELQLLKDTFELEGAPYIHEIGLDPFCVILYSPQQISMLRKLSSENDLKIYLDATGSIINNIQNQKRPYLYSIVVKPNPTLPPLSLADMISTSHNIPKIQFFLSTVKRAVGLTGKQIKVKQVETDYSYALIAGFFGNLQSRDYQRVFGKMYGHHQVWRIASRFHRAAPMRKTHDSRLHETFTKHQKANQEVCVYGIRCSTECHELARSTTCIYRRMCCLHQQRTVTACKTSRAEHRKAI